MSEMISRRTGTGPTVMESPEEMAAREEHEALERKISQAEVCRSIR